MHERLSDAIDNQSGQDNLETYARGDGSYDLAVSGKSNAEDIQTIIAWLPELMQDHQTLAEAVSVLMKIIAAQQIQIQELSHRIEEVMRANVALKAQENAHDVLMKLTAQGSDVAKPQVRIKMKASMHSSLSSRKRSSSTSESATNRTVSISNQLSGLVKALGSLNIDLEWDSKEVTRIRKDVDQIKRSTIAREYEGEMVIKFDSITGDPMVKAKAHRVGQGGRPPRVTKKVGRRK